MVKQARLTSYEVEKMLLSQGFEVKRSKGSHRIYMKGQTRVVVPFHKGKILHPKIVKQVIEAIRKVEL